MLVISKPVIVVAGALSLLLAVLIVFVNLPIRLLADDSLEAIRYTDLEGASVLKGDVWIGLDDVPGLMHVVYSWCPGLSPLSWCMDLQHPAFVGQGRVSYSGTELISISNMKIESADMASLGLASGLVDARISGKIDSMKLRISGCPIRQIEHVEGQLGSNDIRIFGVSTGAHTIQLSSANSNIDARLSGNIFSGDIQLANGKYRAEGEMLAPESMTAMAQSFMSPLGNNRFGWQINGDLPC